MIEPIVALMAFPDYGTDESGDFFIWNGDTLESVTLEEIAGDKRQIITIDFQTVAALMATKELALPIQVFDLEELVIAISKEPKLNEIRKKFDEFALLGRYELNNDNLKKYRKLKISGKSFDPTLLELVGRSFLSAFVVLKRLAKIRGEWERFKEIEVPTMLLLYENLLKGIKFDPDKLSKYRADIEFDYYKSLKTFSAKHDLPLDTPSKLDLNEILASYGFDLQNSSIEYILEFIALKDNFGDDVLSLRKLRITRDALNGISQSKHKCFPEVNSQGTRTSRILLRAPSLQNIAKKYRGVFLPKEGSCFTYVDYDQFEVGIMAALSNDPVLLKLYNQKDLYEHFSTKLFGSKDKRKYAKKIFLSYAYGMTRDNLIKATVEFGGNAGSAKKAFNKFKRFEKWKKDLTKELETERKIGTQMGNYYYLPHKHKPTAKEIRSAVSQKVQGTGSLIFKNALIEISKSQSFNIVLPMHDAILVEHGADTDPQIIIDILCSVMTDFFEGKIQGKASISNFTEE